MLFSKSKFELTLKKSSILNYLRAFSFFLSLTVFILIAIKPILTPWSDASTAQLLRIWSWIQKLSLDQYWGSGWIKYEIFLIIVFFLFLAALEIKKGIAYFQKLKKIQLSQIYNKSGEFLGFSYEVATQIKKEDFIKTIEKWCENNQFNFSKTHENSFGELQYKMTKNLKWFFIEPTIYICAAFALFFVLFSNEFKLELEMKIDERSLSQHVEMLHGVATPELTPVDSTEIHLPNLYRLPFLIEAERLDENDLFILFKQNNEQISTGILQPFHPLSFNGYSLHFRSKSDSGKKSINLKIFDKENKTERKANKLITGSTLQLENGFLEILAIDPEIVDLGTGAKIKLQLENQEMSQFWIFKNYPKYDEIARKASKYSFILENDLPVYSAKIGFIQDPTQFLVFILILFIIFLMILKNIFPSQKINLIWTEDISTFIFYCNDISKSEFLFKKYVDGIHKNLTENDPELAHLPPEIRSANIG